VLVLSPVTAKVIDAQIIGKDENNTRPRRLAVRVGRGRREKSAR
jgi:hypothetical protein